MPAATAAPPATAAPSTPSTPASAGSPAGEAGKGAPSSPDVGTKTGKVNLDAAFASMDEIAAQTTPPGKPGEGDGAQGKLGDGEAGEGGEGTPEGGDPNKGAAAKPGDATPGTGKGQPARAATLREAKDRAEAEVKEWRSKHDALTAELEKLKTNNPDKSAWEKERAEIVKERDELKNEIKFANFTRSPEYKQKYEKPFVDAYNVGRTKAAALKVIEGVSKDEVSGEETTKMRPGAKEDWDQFMGITDEDQAADFAQKTWGTRAPMMIYHREQVQQLNLNRINAIEEYRTNAETRFKQEQEQSAVMEKQINEAWTKENCFAIEKYPDWFKPTDGDTKGNELLERGIALADLAFSPDVHQLPLEKRVKVWSTVRNKAAGFDRLAYRNKQLQAQLTELQTKLKEYEDTEPTGGQGGGKGKPKVEGLAAVDAQIERMASGA